MRPRTRRAPHRAPARTTFARTLPATIAACLTCAVLAPTIAGAAPTPPPPAPQQQLGQVVVVQETPGTRTVIDSAGRTHYLMRRVTPADRKAAAERAAPMRDAALRKYLEASKGGAK